MQTDITALEREATNTTPAKTAGQTAEKHMDKCFNKHRRNDEGESEENRAAQEKASREICDMVKRHMGNKSREGKEKVSRLSIQHMFGKQNIKLAIQKVKKGTVPGRDGFPTEFYSENEEVLDRMAGNLSRLFLKITQDKDMTQAMKCAIVNILYKGRGKDKTEADSNRPYINNTRRIPGNDKSHTD